MELWENEASQNSSERLMEEGTASKEPRKDLTILMVGETGVGKSTFLNAVVNYLLFDNMADAAENLKCTIPTSFEMCDSDMNFKECFFGDPDDNECADKTQSSTQSCRCYNVHIGDLTLKIIDTPGIADCRGVKRDQFNLKNILSVLSSYKELNAICVFLKPNDGKVSVLFKYCILELLTHLNKSACQNILFVFTNTRGTLYKPGDTAKSLRKILEDIRLKPPNVEIKFDQENFFCFDNDAFRYLVAISEPNNIVFDVSAHDEFEKSWKLSVRECVRLFKRISDIKPHAVRDTLSINNVKTKITNLRKPIALIAEHIGKEIILCQNHEKKIEEFAGDNQELEKELYTPALDIITEPLDKPITVCSDPECCEKKSIGNATKVHYKSICHKPCYLKNSDGNIIGNTALLDCLAFNKYKRCGRGSLSSPEEFHPDTNLKLNKKGLAFGFPTVRTKSETCFVCSHSYLVHVTINYETKVATKQILDNNKHNRMEMNKQSIDRRQNQIDIIKAKVEEIKEELRFITECSAYFAKFLMENAITPFNDALEEYMNFCIANERKGNRDAVVIDGLKAMLNSYNREKDIIEKLSEEECGKGNLSSDGINGKIQQMFALKHYGGVIKQHMDLNAHAQLKAAAAYERNIHVGMKNTSSLTASVKQFFSKLCKF